MAEAVQERYPEAEVIAGVATGGIAIGALVAEQLDLPFVYVRSSAKGHGLGNQIEGDLDHGQKVVVIEDLISTGMSSLKAVDALREAGAQVMGMVAIFSYEFGVAAENFERYNCDLVTMSNYDHMLDHALTIDYVRESELDSLRAWRHEPSNWKP